MDVPISEIEAQKVLDEISRDYRTKFQSFVGKDFTVTYDLQHNPRKGKIRSVIHIKKKERIIRKKEVIEVRFEIDYKNSTLDVITPKKVYKKMIFESANIIRRLIETNNAKLNSQTEQIVNNNNFRNLLVNLEETVKLKFGIDECKFYEFKVAA